VQWVDVARNLYVMSEIMIRSFIRKDLKYDTPKGLYVTLSTRKVHEIAQFVENLKKFSSDPSDGRREIRQLR